MYDPTAERPTFPVIRVCGACNGGGKGKCIARCFQCNGDGDRLFEVFACDLTAEDFDLMSPEEQDLARQTIIAEDAHNHVARNVAESDVLVKAIVTVGGVVTETVVPEWEHRDNVLQSLIEKRWIKMGRVSLELTSEGEKALARAKDRAASEAVELTLYFRQVDKIGRMPKYAESKLDAEFTAVKPIRRARKAA